MAAVLLRRGRQRRRPRTFKRRVTIEILSGPDIDEYRLPVPVIRGLIDVYATSAYANTTLRSNAISPETEILVALRFFAKGGYCSEFAHVNGVSKAAASAIVRKVSSFLSEKAKGIIKLPSTRQELIATAESFSEKYGIPATIGAIDGTHVGIVPPPDENAFAYRNRKGYTSLNVQVMSDLEMKFLDAVPIWPGSTHDSFMLPNSGLYQQLENNPIYRNFIILGDSGYPCKKWLITPLGNPATQAETRFNTCHKRARSVVERAIGHLKTRFRCLHHKETGLLLFKKETCAKIVLACMVLHNLCINHGVEMDDEDLERDLEQLPIQDPVEDAPMDDVDGIEARRRLIQLFE